MGSFCNPIMARHVQLSGIELSQKAERCDLEKAAFSIRNPCANKFFELKNWVITDLFHHRFQIEGFACL